MNQATPPRRDRDGVVRIGDRKILGVMLAGMVVATAATVGISQSPPSPEAAEFPAAAFAASAAAPGSSEQPDSGPASRAGAAGELIGFSHADDSGTQTITLVHTGKSWMAVYHIDRSGKIRLVSSRPIEADFTLQLNATSPLPEEIRQLGGRER